MTTAWGEAGSSIQVFPSVWGSWFQQYLRQPHWHCWPAWQTHLKDDRPGANTHPSTHTQSTADLEIISFYSLKSWPSCSVSIYIWHSFFSFLTTDYARQISSAWEIRHIYRCPGTWSMWYLKNLQKQYTASRHIPAMKNSMMLQIDLKNPIPHWTRLFHFY